MTPKIKVFRVGSVWWRVSVPLMRDASGVVPRTWVGGGWTQDGEHAIRWALGELKVVRRLAAAGWVAEQ